MGTFDRQVATAKRLIKKYGALCQLQVNIDGVPIDDDMPWLPSDGTKSEIDCFIALFPVDNLTMKRLQFITASEVPTGFETGYMAQTATVPTLKDTIKKPDGSIWRILNIDVINPNAEQDILYELIIQQ